MRIRSFIAINLPLEIKKQLLILLEKLKKDNQNSLIKWVKPDGLHLTLHFLGSQEESVLEKVGEAIENLKFKIKNSKLELKLEKIDAFPNLSRPRVLFISCLGGSTSEILKKFQKELGKELEKLEIEVDKRPWTSHITLARFKAPAPFRIMNNELGIKNLLFQIKSIDLMKSELMPTGARYTILKSFSI